MEEKRVIGHVLTVRYRIVRQPWCGGGVVVLVYTPIWSLVGGVDGWRCVEVLAGPRGTNLGHLDLLQYGDNYSLKWEIFERSGPVHVLIILCTYV